MTALATTSDQVAQSTQSFIQSVLENLWDCRVYNVPGQPVLWLNCCDMSLLISSLDLCCFNCACCLSSSHFAEIGRAWLHLLDILLACPGELLSDPPKAASSPGWTSPGPSASSYQASWWSSVLVISAEIAPIWQCPSYCVGPKRRHSI